MQAIYT